MTGRWPLLRVIVTMCLVLIALGGANSSLNPDRATIGNMAMVVLPVEYATVVGLVIFAGMSLQVAISRMMRSDA
jgi:hypothetical protein